MTAPEEAPPLRGPLPEGTETTKVFKGTGVMVKGQQPGGALPAAVPGAVAAGPGVTLNFEGAELREVIRNILTDILGESYTIDPAVGWSVTIRTTSCISREALAATLEMILRSNGATMVKEGTIWRVVPAAAAVRGNITPQLGNSSRALPPGFSVQIVPLKYVGVRQMMAILEPFQKDATTIRADDLRNLLIVSGTELELKHMLETIDMFDVNWLAGLSFGLFTLQNAEVKTVASTSTRSRTAEPSASGRCCSRPSPAARRRQRRPGRRRWPRARLPAPSSLLRRSRLSRHRRYRSTPSRRPPSSSSRAPSRVGRAARSGRRSPGRWAAPRAPPTAASGSCATSKWSPTRTTTPS